MAFVAMLASCADGRSVVIVTLDSDVPVTGVAKIRVAVENQGQPAQPVELKLPNGSFNVPPPQRFSLTFDRDRQGEIRVTVDAIDGDGTAFASASSVGSIEPSHTSELTVRFVSLLATDMGVDATDAARLFKWTPKVSGTGNNLNGAWVAANGEVFVVGDFGTILHSGNRGLSWQFQTSNSSRNLYGVWGSGIDDIYAVGQGGAILHSLNGGVDWTTSSSGTTNVLYSVWGSGNADVYVVGNGGTILHSNSKLGPWTAQTTGTTNSIADVWGTGPNDVFAVGDGGLILHTSNQGLNWSAQTSGTMSSLLAVEGTTTTTLSSGFFGTLLRSRNGQPWSQQASGTQSYLWGIGATGIVGEAYVVGDSGTILRTTDDGDTWTIDDSGTQNGLRDIAGSTTVDIYCVGLNGTILRRE